MMNYDLQQRNVGFAWIYVLVFTFLLLTLHFIIFPIINSKVIPALVAQANDSYIEGKITNIMKMFRIASYGFLICGIIYGILSIVKRGQDEYYV